MVNMPKQAETLALIICTYQRPAAVKQLIESLQHQTEPPDEILIVDSSQDSATEAVVCDAWNGNISGTPVQYFKVPPEHKGLTRQRNYGIARTKGNLIAFLDDDTVPSPTYFQEIRRCFKRHPQAAGVGGYITNSLDWHHTGRRSRPSLSTWRWGDWERRDDYRWRLRKLLGLVSPLPPGWMPPSGHGRSVGALPPDGKDYQVEYIIGCAMTWRRKVFERHTFSHYFEGYGLYEDLDFCIRVSRESPIYLCTTAQLAHYHEPAGRPDMFKYGVMVVRNGWYVWRKRWPSPPWQARLQWWATTLLLAACRLCDARGKHKIGGVQEAFGRVAGLVSVLRSAPNIER